MKKLSRTLLMMLVITMCTGLTSCDVIVNVDNPVNPKEPTNEDPTADNRTPAEVAKATKLMADAFKDGALVSFTFTYEGVEYEVEFKKVGDEYVFQTPAPAPARARATTRAIKDPNIWAIMERMLQHGNDYLRLTVIEKTSGKLILQDTCDDNAKVNEVQGTVGKLIGMAVNGEEVPTYEDQTHGIEVPMLSMAELTSGKEEIYPGDVVEIKFRLLPSDAPFNADDFPDDFVFEISHSEVFELAGYGKNFDLSFKPAKEIAFEIKALELGKATISVKGLPDYIECNPLDLTVEKKTVDLGRLSESYTVKDGDILTGSGDQPITIPDGYTVTLRDAGLKIKKTDVTAITCEGSATIILEGENFIYVPDKSTECAIHSKEQTGSDATPPTLTIKGDGSLFVYGAMGIVVQNMTVEDGKLEVYADAYTAIMVDELKVTGGKVYAEGGKVYRLDDKMYLENEDRPAGDAVVEISPAITGPIALGEGLTLFEGDVAYPTTPAEDQTTVTKRYARIRK